MKCKFFLPDGRRYRKRIQIKNIFYITRADKCEKCARGTLQATIFVTENAETFQWRRPHLSFFKQNKGTIFLIEQFLFLFMTFSYWKKDWLYIHWVIYLDSRCIWEKTRIFLWSHISSCLKVKNEDTGD